jgi:hypothetical protein
MEAIEAVLDLAKERDEMEAELNTYEDWFETLVGKEVTLSIKRKKKTRFVTCLVVEFVEGEGWELEGDDDETYLVSFPDFASGKVWLN